MLKLLKFFCDKLRYFIHQQVSAVRMADAISARRQQQYVMHCRRQTDRQTDGQTDRQTDGYAIVCSSRHCSGLLNPLMGTGNYSATSNNMKLVH